MELEQKFGPQYFANAGLAAKLHDAVQNNNNNNNNKTS